MRSLGRFSRVTHCPYQAEVAKASVDEAGSAISRVRPPGRAGDRYAWPSLRETRPRGFRFRNRLSVTSLLSVAIDSVLVDTTHSSQGESPLTSRPPIPTIID